MHPKKRRPAGKGSSRGKELYIANWREYVICPACVGRLLSTPASLQCLECRAEYEVVEDIPKLLTDDSLDTKLDVDR